MSAYSRRLLAVAGGLLFGGFTGALLDDAVVNSPDATFKGVLAGLGLGLLAAALVHDERR